jgi:hypothetical protein
MAVKQQFRAPYKKRNLIDSSLYLIAMLVNARALPLLFVYRRGMPATNGQPGFLFPVTKYPMPSRASYSV